MFVRLHTARHDRPVAVNKDHILYVEENAERSNVYLSNGTMLQVRESVGEIVGDAPVEAAASAEAGAAKPGSKRETK